MDRRTVAELRQLRDALLEIDQLRLPEYRNLYVSQWEQQVGASVPRFADARHDIASLLRTAGQIAGGLSAWAEIVVDGQGRTQPVQRFLDLLGEDERRADVRSRISPPATTPIRVFASYAHDDDAVTYKRISTLVRDLDAAYRNHVGSRAGIFKDDVTVRIGEDWRQAVEEAGRSAAILLAFVSPAYLRSDWCRKEVTDFLDRGQVMLPLLFFDRDRLVSQFAADPVWQRLDRLHMVEIQSLRSADPGSAGWLKIRDRIALRIAELLAGRP